MSRCLFEGAGWLRQVRLSLGAAVAALFIGQAVSAVAFDESTVVNWTGTGSNVSYMALDFGTGESLVWGYRWSGSATTYDMLMAIDASDTRLSLSLPLKNGSRVAFGMGYDVDNDGGTFTFGTPGYTTETGSASDADDLFHEGWMTHGFWAFYYYGGNVSSPSDDPYDGGAWSQSGVGIAAYSLTNNGWSGFTFSTDLDSYTSVAPAAAVAADAVPEPSTLILLTLGVVGLVSLRRSRVQVGLAMLLALGMGTTWSLQAEVDTAVEVISYTAGANAGSRTNSSAALGLPPSMVDTVSYPNVLSPFSPSYKSSDIVVFGNGGSITLRLDKYAVVTAGKVELGIFANVGLNDPNWPSGVADATGSTLGTAASAILEVSADGVHFVSLGLITADMFANYYTDLSDPYSATPGSAVADFSKPYIGSPSDFAGMTYEEIVAQLDGSAGGTWIDLDASGLTEVGWVRLTSTSDDNPFKLDAVTVNGQTVGVSTVPEPTVGALLWLGAGLGFCARRALRRKGTGL